MAWTRLGTDTWTSNANSGSSSRTIPAGTEITLIYVAGYLGTTANYFSSGTLTINGVGMTTFGATSDDSTSFFMGCGWRLMSPASGAQTVAWDWSGAGAPSDGVLFVAVHYSGINTSDPVRDSDGTQEAALPYETKTLTAVAGDMISIAVFGFVGGSAGSVTAWSNATEISEFEGFVNADITLAEHEPSGNVVIATTTAVNYQDGGIIALVMKPATGGGGAGYGALERTPLRGIERGVLLGMGRH